ncbi:hypothetical protein BT93_L0598 [Corymbia citriodora subsp. variegata]|uniref:Uncharacterized protein n=1 Tax=Corymbia citriodora subsp. variegata TaxID=360336 RepID=A0A8T0CXB4_CORYI|nr:hypothetical protein BT93_L0598 [Corymbia citriodora subsp. variegata]
MHNHLGRCKKYPYANVEKRQKSASNELVGVGTSISASPWKFDQETSRKDLAAMFIIGELPFKFVELEAFRKFVCRIQPKFLIPSRNTLRENCYKYTGFLSGL